MLNKAKASRILRASLTLAIAALLAGCAGANAEVADQQASDSAAASNDFMDASGVSDVYWETTKELPLPEGYSYPELEGLSDGESYQSGVGKGEAFSFYVCAWESEYVSAIDTNTERAEKALQLIKDLPGHPYYQAYFDLDSFLPIHNEMVEAAELGDPSKIQEDLDLNCNVEAPSE